MDYGELLHRKYRLQFWAVIFAVALLGVPTGYVFGRMMVGNHYDFAEAISSHPQISVALLVAYLVAMTMGSWLLRKIIDEVEMAHNMFASAVGLTAYLVIFPVWSVLAAAHYVPPVNDWAVFLATTLCTLIAYFGRKWLSR